MNALLLIAHGSRRQQSNDEVIKLAEQLRAACSSDYRIVHAGFLELAKPSITDGIARCVEDGARQIIILPYFLNSGTHVVKDIPEIVDSEKNRYPNIDILVTPHLGASSRMVELLMDSANSASSV